MDPRVKPEDDLLVEVMPMVHRTKQKGRHGAGILHLIYQPVAD
jgi:hypothetical protein